MNDFITLTPETLDMIAFISKISISPSDKYTYATNILLLFKIIFLSKIALYESLFIVVFHCLNLEYFTNILKFYFVIYSISMHELFIIYSLFCICLKCI